MSIVNDGFRTLIDKLVQERKEHADQSSAESESRGYESPDDVPDRVLHNYWDNQVTTPVRPLFHFPHR